MIFLSLTVTDLKLLFYNFENFKLDFSRKDGFDYLTVLHLSIPLKDDEMLVLFGGIEPVISM